MAKNLKEEVIKILLENKLLTRQQLEEALKIQKQKQGKLRDILISLKFVKNDDLMAALSESSGIPLISLDKLRIDKEIVKLIPEELARRYVLIAVSKISNTLTIAMSDPLNIFAIDDLKALTRFVIHPIISSEEEILSALDRYYGQGGKLESLLREGDESLLKDVKASSDGKVQDADTLLKMMGEKPVIRLTNLILTEAVRRAASDVLIEPQEKKTTVRYRVDGILQESPTVPKALHSAIISRIKVMSNLNIAEHRLPQDGRFKVRVLKREVDYRVSVLPSSFGEKIALRVLDKSSSTLDINKLGFEEQVLERLKESARRPHGMILVCGPTGCGKTTSLYSVLQLVNSPAKNIVTVEDPVEYELEGVNQVTCLPKAGLTFASALRSILRQDPDIIMVGEIRDFETVDVAIKAALTGHLVLSTLHTTSAAGSVIRMVDMGVEPFLITSSCLLFIAQRLVRRVCSNCKEAYEINNNLRKNLGLDKIEKKINAEIKSFYKGKGCPSCQNTGYKGRVVISEAILLSSAIKDIIIKRESEASLLKQAGSEGMNTIRENGLIKAAKGITALEEILRVTVV
ncbi:MAG: Flp pilus assembly complex ATPase component TadA [Candidatus Omnitrophica bacterium]|nr:Flp pilus assembly complex ATPase component TadA [Candidatus Omnitrophota bacterium]